MSSDYFENGCANCLSNDHLSPLQTKDFEKLQSLTQLPVRTVYKKVVCKNEDCIDKCVISDWQ